MHGIIIIFAFLLFLIWGTNPPPPPPPPGPRWRPVRRWIGTITEEEAE
ncbi:MAG: hypothetical protein SWJ54_14705 [Cyanobacteriota bacterium]|nr:hypothetical protein [Cyanobacteriota bacterium]